jgi:hypothetical protein
MVRHCVRLACLLSLGLVTAVAAGTVKLAWDDVNPPEKYMVLRCDVPSGATVCTPTTDLPGMPIPGTARAYTDPNASGAECWAVQRMTAAGIRGMRAVAADGTTPYICKQPLTAPPPTTVTVTQVGSTLRILWGVPVFDATTVPATDLTSYQVSRRGDPNPPPPGQEWALIATLPPTTTTWIDTAPYPAECITVAAIYGTTLVREAPVVCVKVTSGTLPLPLAPPTNLREVP